MTLKKYFSHPPFSNPSTLANSTLIILFSHQSSNESTGFECCTSSKICCAKSHTHHEQTCSKDLLGCMISSIQFSSNCIQCFHSHELWFIELGAMMQVRSGLRILRTKSGGKNCSKNQVVFFKRLACQGFVSIYLSSASSKSPWALRSTLDFTKEDLSLRANIGWKFFTNHHFLEAGWQMLISTQSTKVGTYTGPMPHLPFFL